MAYFVRREQWCVLRHASLELLLVGFGKALLHEEAAFVCGGVFVVLIDPAGAVPGLPAAPDLRTG